MRFGIGPSEFSDQKKSNFGTFRYPWQEHNQVNFLFHHRGHALLTLEELLASNEALPSIPKVIALLINELDQDEPDLRKISQLINTDPVLATRLLRLANSAQFQFANKISSVSEALALMGLAQVRTLALAAAVTGAFTAVPGLDMNQFWRYSLNAAKLARALAGMIRQNQPAAFTAGLIHALGELVMHLGLSQELLVLNQKVPPLSLKRAATERKLLGYCYADVGAGFARNWQFPQATVDALEHQCAPFDNETYEPLAGILHLASWRARAREANYNEQDLIDTFPDEVALNLGIDIDMALQQEPISWTSNTEVSILI